LTARHVRSSKSGCTHVRDIAAGPRMPSRGVLDERVARRKDPGLQGHRPRVGLHRRPWLGIRRTIVRLVAHHGSHVVEQADRAAWRVPFREAPAVVDRHALAGGALEGCRPLGGRHGAEDEQQDGREWGEWTHVAGTSCRRLDADGRYSIVHPWTGMYDAHDPWRSP
jgi:hypothetical protein